MSDTFTCPFCGISDDTNRLLFRHGPHEDDVHCQACGWCWNRLNPGVGAMEMLVPQGHMTPDDWAIIEPARVIAQQNLAKKMRYAINRLGL